MENKPRNLQRFHVFYSRLPKRKTRVFLREKAHKTPTYTAQKSGSSSKSLRGTRPSNGTTKDKNFYRSNHQKIQGLDDLLSQPSLIALRADKIFRSNTDPEVHLEVHAANQTSRQEFPLVRLGGDCNSIGYDAWPTWAKCPNAARLAHIKRRLNLMIQFRSYEP